MVCEVPKLVTVRKIVFILIIFTAINITIILRGELGFRIHVRYQKNTSKQQPHADEYTKPHADEYTTDATVNLNPIVKYGIPGHLICPEVSPQLTEILIIDKEKALSVYSNMSGLNPDEMKLMKHYSKYLGRPLNTTSSLPPIFEPVNCNASQSVAIIIPFRDREEHLKYFLGHLIPILQNQLARFGIFVVQQYGNSTFNKGRLMNTGFHFVVKAGRQAGINFNCFIFHDVDLLLENERNLYRCRSGDEVSHLSTKIDKFKYENVCCGMTVGGVLGFTEDRFRKVNGFSNSYWGWGAEDDDMNARLNHKNLKVIRPHGELGRYTMIKHEKDPGNEENMNKDNLLEKAKERIDTDGLTSLDTEIKSISILPLFTKLDVEVGKP